MITDSFGQLSSAGVSPTARVFAAICGIVLCFWAMRKLSKRELLIPICSMIIAVGLSLVAFASVPALFDQVSYLVGIKYPPLLYLILVVLCLLVVILNLAARLSIIDSRCRRLAQEVALIKNDMVTRTDS